MQIVIFDNTLLYGRSAPSIAEQLNKSVDEAQEIIDKFFKAFPKVKAWINKTISDAHKYGYVEDIAGRRRRLPDILLPKFDIKFADDRDYSDFNPLLESKNIVHNPSLSIIDSYKKKCSECKNRKDFDDLQQKALRDNIKITNNSGFISQAERQAVNARVQGGAATLTKNALIKLYNDPRLKEIGAYLINTVHDEILIEAPNEYADQAADILCEDMVNSAKDFVKNVPMKCDAYKVDCWYLDEFFVLVENEFKKLLDSGISDIDAFEKLCSIRTESTRDQIYEIVHGYMKTIPANIKNAG